MIKLLDAEAAHREHPRTFSIPRRSVRKSLRPGDQVKLLFKVNDPTGAVEVERMWVEVARVENDRYLGRLDSDPVHADLACGDWVEFGPEHVAARFTQPDDPLFIDPNSFAIVSRAVWDEGAWPGKLERRAVPDPTFSGWVVLAGEEDERFLSDPANFLPIVQSALLDRFRFLDSGLEGAVGTTMVWNKAELEYQVSAPDT
jgi:hypothetical protein